MLVITIALTGIFLMRLLNVGVALSDDKKKTILSFKDPRTIELSREWITPEDRLVLEALDSRLVGVIDILMTKQHDDDVNALEHLFERIERRLYVFPFLCIHQHDLNIQVSGIVGKLVEQMRPIQKKQADETLYKFKTDKWASNRF